MKKVLFITLEYSPQKGGIASYYTGIVQELVQQGYEVKVMTEKLLFRWFWPRWLKAYFKVRKMIKKEKPDLIFVGQILPLGTVAYLLRNKIPYILFLHGMDILMAQKSWRKRWLAKKIFLQAESLIANSHFTKQLIENFLSNVPQKPSISVIYPCPNLAFEVKKEEIEILRRKLGLSGKKVILTLGRVVERKGHKTVLQALPEIISHIPEVIYLIVGDGPYLSQLTKLSKELNLQPFVRFIGQISDEEKPLYYALSDIFVMPSYQKGADVEGFGLVFLEAALFAKPGIGGKSGGIPEAILDGETGILVEPQNAKTLARIIIQLLRDKNLQTRLGEKAKERVLDQFVWTKQIKPLLEILES
jgi:phosphatidylinositol alpha-1,6-mannosyltransferase